MKNFIILSRNFNFLMGKHFITAIGVFDGVHRGHREIIRTAKNRADEMNAGVMALTFIPHPRTLLAANDPPELLISADERVDLLINAGADACAYINFNARTAALEPGVFLNALKNNGIFNIAGICVGSKWRFGRKGAGNKDILNEFCKKNNWTFDPVEELAEDGSVISSTLIRQAIYQKNIPYAAKMLGRNITISGNVEHGFKIAGSKLAAPTANLHQTGGFTLPDGVYAAGGCIDGKSYPAAVNIGIAPTFGNDLRRTEIHFIGFYGSLYGRNITVDIYRFLRDERKFDSPDSLKIQIAADINEIIRCHKLANL